MPNKLNTVVDVPKTWVGQVATANTGLDGSGTVATIVTAGQNGSRIDFIEIKATVTTTDGMVRLYVYDGTNTRLIKEITVTATTKSATVPAYSTTWTPGSPIGLAPTWLLKASTEKSEAINVAATGGDL